MKAKKEVKFNKPVCAVLLMAWAMAIGCLIVLTYDLFINGVSFGNHGSHWLMGFSVITTIVLTATASIFEDEEDSDDKVKVSHAG